MTTTDTSATTSTKDGTDGDSSSSAFAMGDLEREVRSFIASNFIVDEDPESLASDASLTQAGVLDSMGVLELIMFLEERYGFAVPDEDTLPENLDSIGRIVHYIERRRAERAKGA